MTQYFIFYALPYKLECLFSEYFFSKVRFLPSLFSKPSKFHLFTFPVTKTYQIKKKKQYTRFFYKQHQAEIGKNSSNC